MREIYKKIILYLLRLSRLWRGAMIAVLIAFTVRLLFPKQPIELFIFFTIIILGIVGLMYATEERFPGPSGELARRTFTLSILALMLAGAAFFTSSKDSEVLQEQLTELKKISQMLESKNW